MVLVLIFSTVVLFAPGNSRAESSFFRQPLVVDYAEDRTLCQSLIREHEDPDDHFKTHYWLIPPTEAIESPLFDYDQPPGETTPGRYSRGRFDFDNDGVIDLVIGVTESFGGRNNDRYFIFPNTPKVGDDLPEEEQPPYEPWPDGFGLEWLGAHSRYVFPDMWGEKGIYTLRHQKRKHPTYEIGSLHSRLFRFRDVTYLLISPYDGNYKFGALLRPKPQKAVEEVCIFRRAGRS
jgi:hypothetical protein